MESFKIMAWNFRKYMMLNVIFHIRIQETKEGKNPLTFVTQESAFKDKTSKELNIIVKSDVHGSSEAIKGAINQIKNEEVKAKIILSDKGYICATGDRFVKNKLEINCDIVDMEAYALAKICKLHDIEFKCFKYISDYANDESSNDWIENCHKGASEFLSLYPDCK